MELKNTAWELCKVYTSFNSWINQAKERISEIEDQLNEIKQEGKIREKRVKKKKNKASKKYVIMWKDLIYTWSVYLNMTGRINPSWKKCSGYYPREHHQPSKAGQHSNLGNTENTTKIILKNSNPKAHNHQIHQHWNEGKNAKGSKRERLCNTKGSPSDLQGISWQKPYKPEESGANIQHP